MVQKVRKGREVAYWFKDQEKWVVEDLGSISKAKKANGLGSRCWKPGDVWPPAPLGSAN